jgi:rSAM/selenodomain-associated transferase 1
LKNFEDTSQVTPTRIVVFAKAPLEGFAKTRLIPFLGAANTATLAKRLLQHSVAQAVLAQIGPVELCVAPDKHHAVWAELELPSSVVWSEQGNGDLGVRLARVAKRIIANGESVLFMGTDCPALDADVLQSASAALARQDTCLVPVTDGGYALLGLGLGKFHISLFQDIPWSTDQVAQLTRNRIQSLGWSLEELAVLRDIDDPQDLKWLPRHLRETEDV